MVAPNRMLSEKRGIFGLTGKDFGLAAAVLVIYSSVSQGSPFEILALPIALLVLATLIPIRLRKRPKVIRDFISRMIGGRRMYDPRS